MAPSEADLARSCESTFRGIVQSCARLFDESLALVMETDDPAGPHRARVALRRLTTALDAFAPILRRKRSAVLRSEAKAIFRRLGKLRDSDVYLIGAADNAADRVPDNQRLREKVRRKLRSAGALCFAHQALQAAEEQGDLYRRSNKAKTRRAGPVVAFAGHALSEAWAVCRSYGPSVKAIPEPGRHDFRKEMKTLRYLAEFFSDHFPDSDDKPFIRDFKAMQDALGAMNDFAVALKIEGRKPPKQPPLIVSAAMSAAEALWAQLYASPVPWRDQATLRP